MKQYQVAQTIEARPETVWSILTDASKYSEWDPNIERVEGEILHGAKIKVFTKLSPGRAFPVKVTQLVPAQTMVWTGGMPLGLFRGERTFSLSPTENNGTNFSMCEIFSGLLFPLIGRTIPDLSESFQQFADGLKQRAEAAA